MNIYLYFSLLFLEIIILFGICMYAFGLLFSALKGAPYVPTSKQKLAEILEVVKPKESATFIELGSGDGRMVRFAAQTYGVKGIGIEVNPLLVWWSRLLAKRDRVEQVAFLKKNIFATDMSSASYIYIFLMPELIVKLLPKFEAELKKGTIIISHGFKILPWEKKLWKTLPSPTFSTFYYRI